MSIRRDDLPDNVRVMVNEQLARDARPRRKQPERQRELAIMQLLNLRRYPAAVTDAGVRYRSFPLYPPPGWPDITVCGQGGRFIGIEVKSATGRQSADQQAMQAAIERIGGVYLLARGVDDIVTLFQEVKA